MDKKEFFMTVKKQRAAAKEFARTHSPESRDEYFKLSDLIDAEIERVDKLMENKDNGKATNDDTRESAQQGELVQGD